MLYGKVGFIFKILRDSTIWSKMTPSYCAFSLQEFKHKSNLSSFWHCTNLRERTPWSILYTLSNWSSADVVFLRDTICLEILVRSKRESESEVTFDSGDLLSYCMLPHTGLQQLKGLKWDPEQVLEWERREFRRICPASLPASFISTHVSHY